MAKQSSLKANQIQTVTLEKKKGSDAVTGGAATMPRLEEFHCYHCGYVGTLPVDLPKTAPKLHTLVCFKWVYFHINTRRVNVKLSITSLIPSHH